MPYTDEFLIQQLERISSALERIASAVDNQRHLPVAALDLPTSSIQAMNEYINDAKAAEITGMSRAWFQRMRVAGGGPPYTKIGRGSVRYRLSDLHAWMTLNRVKHTAESYERKRGCPL